MSNFTELRKNAREFLIRLSDEEIWALKQELASPGRYYGNGGTIHHTTAVDVETFKGKVVSVWFRCQALNFHQSECGPERAAEMDRMMDEGAGAEISGVEVVDE